MKTRQNKVKPLRRREKTMVRKGWKRENSLPPPTYAAGGSYRRGLGPRDCQTFARPSVVELFHRRACSRPPRNFFSLEITARNDERRPRNLTRTNVLFKGQLRGYYSSTGIARNLSERVHWSRKEKNRDRWFFDGRRTPRCSRCPFLDDRSSPPDLPRYLPLTFGQLLLHPAEFSIFLGINIPIVLIVEGCVGRKVRGHMARVKIDVSHTRARSRSQTVRGALNAIEGKMRRMRRGTK